MGVTRSEMKQIIRLARQAFPEEGAATNFLKKTWDGIVATRVSQNRTSGVCPLTMIRDEPDGVEKVTRYLKETIAQRQSDSQPQFTLI